jgi:hypothetical protein
MKRGPEKKEKVGKCKHCGIRIYSNTVRPRVCCDRCKTPSHAGGYLRNPHRLSLLKKENKSL